jgi:hypothetical protein
MTHTALHPSNAGIGKKLNIANHNDIIHPKAKNIHIPNSDNIISHIFIAHTGPDNLSTDDFILSLLNDIRFFHNVFSIDNVSSVCAQIS